MNLHEGHRQRLKERFIKSGLNDFEDHNILELLLFFSVPRSDTNEIGHKLLKHFGSLSNVFDADIKELCKVEGIGIHSATLIKLIPELCSVYNKDKNENIEIMNSSEIAGKYFVPRFMGKKDEEVHIMLLDDKKKLLRSEMISKGTVNACAASVRSIVDKALKYNATAVVLAHNHPGGVALPSKNDICVTKRIYQALQLMDIHLCDHIVVAGDDFVSMKDSGMFAEFDFN